MKENLTLVKKLKSIQLTKENEDLIQKQFVKRCHVQMLDAQ
jgi:hypothetical protein